ncbi:hypothetical protein [Streptomyces sp. HB2AG]|uniref:hypothetical protein n=1 Tax=Streptomyces sp. HB2AG TaxID=2983400 RepID=UPI0022AA66F2|nr:hypothetical protein [Streptomyces sp. HB2AG]MCZ2524527.1 hypothetical protein [Streptomyces sp. HB2AG]
MGEGFGQWLAGRAEWARWSLSPGRWRGWAVAGTGAARPPADPRARRAQQELVARVWQDLCERLSAAASERVAEVGEVLRTAELDLDAEESEARAAYTASLDAYHAAGRLLDGDRGGDGDHNGGRGGGDGPGPVDATDAAFAVVLADRALELFAAAHDLHAGRRPRPPVVRCFYNPLHGAAHEGGGASASGSRKAAKRRRVRARDVAAERRPACARCRRAISAGLAPEVLPALVTVPAGRRGQDRYLVPYYAAPAGRRRSTPAR